MTNEIKKAFADAEKELQEKQIESLKKTVKELLEKKVDLEKDKQEIEKKISILKQTIDDFKAGRLDKVKELIEKDDKAKDLIPFKIIIINKQVVTQPWNWQYQIVPTNYYPSEISFIGSGNGVMGLCGSSTTTISNNLNSIAGTTCSNFTGGSYNIGGRIINL